MRNAAIVLLILAAIGGAVWFFRPEIALRRAYTISEYEDVARKYPDSAAAVTARARVEKLRFKEAKEKGTANAFLDFEELYPSSRFLKELPRTPLGFPAAAEAVFRVIRMPETVHKAVAVQRQSLRDEKGKEIVPPPADARRGAFPPLDRFYLILPLEGGKGTVELKPADWVLTDDKGRTLPLVGVLRDEMIIRTGALKFPDKDVRKVKLAFLAPVDLKSVKLKAPPSESIELKLPFLKDLESKVAAGTHYYRGAWVERARLIESGFFVVDGRIYSPESIRIGGRDFVEGKIRSVKELLDEGWIYREGGWLNPDAARREFPARYLGRWCSTEFKRAAGGEVFIDGEWKPEKDVLGNGKYVAVKVRGLSGVKVEGLLLKQTATARRLGIIRAGKVYEWDVPAEEIVETDACGRKYLEKIEQTNTGRYPDELLKLAAWWRTEGSGWPNAAVYERVCRLRAGRILHDRAGWRPVAYDAAAPDYETLARRVAADQALFITDPSELTVQPPEGDTHPWDGLRCSLGLYQGCVLPSASFDYVVATFGPPQEAKRRWVKPWGMLDYYRYGHLWLAVNAWNDILAVDVAGPVLALKLQDEGSSSLTFERPWLGRQRAGTARMSIMSFRFSGNESTLAYLRGKNAAHAVDLISERPRPSLEDPAMRSVILNYTGSYLLTLGESVRLGWPASMTRPKPGAMVRTAQAGLKMPAGAKEATAGAVMGDKRMVAIGTDNGGVYLMDWAKGFKEELKFRAPDRAPIIAAAASPDDRLVAFATDHFVGALEVLPPYRKFAGRDVRQRVKSIRFAADGGRVLILTSDGSASYDIAHDRFAYGPTFPARSGELLSAAVLDDLNWIGVFRTPDGLAVRHSGNTVVCYGHVQGIDPKEFTVWQVSPGGNFVACGTLYQQWNVWKLQPRFLPFKLEGARLVPDLE